MFTPDGQKRISSLEDVITSRLVFIFKGEQEEGCGRPWRQLGGKEGKG